MKFSFFLIAIIGCFNSIIANEKPAADAPPRVFCLIPEQLVKAKARVLVGDPALKPAMDRIISAGDHALKQAPVSVMDKTTVPPSGDKHDYTSIGPYWWPDPSKPDGLPYIRKDGLFNPDYSKIGDAQNWGRLNSAVRSLAYAWYFTNNEKYADHAAKLLRVWFINPDTKMNPNLLYAQAIPGRCTGRCIGIIDTSSIPSLIDCLGLLESSNAWTPDDHQALKQWFMDFGNWLQFHPQGQKEATRRNNHATWYHAQLASIAMFTGNIPLARWICCYVKNEIIPSQIEPDGRQPEELTRTKSLGYSCFNLRGLFTVAAIGRNVDVDLWHFSSPDGRSIKKALDFITPYTESQKNWPYEQIEPINPTYRLLETLYQAAIIYDHDTYMSIIRTLPADQVNTAAQTLLYNQAQ